MTPPRDPNSPRPRRLRAGLSALALLAAGGAGAWVAADWGIGQLEQRTEAAVAGALADCHLTFATTVRPRDMPKPVVTPRQAAAMIREAGEPSRSISARRTMPTKPTVSSTAHQRRCTIHGGTARRSPRAKNAPWGKKYP